MAEKTVENKVLSIEGFLEEDGIRLKYSLPEITVPEMLDFYRTFTVQLCKRIGQLDGAENLFLIEDEPDMEESDVEEVQATE